jgi:hypothetical protein
MIRAFAAVCFAFLAVSAAANAQDAGCYKDTDCKGARICVDHACVDAPAVKTCARDLDCPGDEICEQHLCLPPANAKKPAKGKPARRDLIKEAARRAKEEREDKPAPSPGLRAPIIVPVPASGIEQPPTSTPPPLPPPSLIVATPPPSPVIEKPAPAAEPVPPPRPVPVAEPVPARTKSAPPPPPSDLILTPPPLVAAAAPPEQTPAEASSGIPIVFDVALTAGIHVWSRADTGTEMDFGLDLNGGVGVRLNSLFAIELIAQGSYTPMLAPQGKAARTGLLGGFGLGVRFDHPGPIPGHFVIGGMGSFAAISAPDAATQSVSGGQVLLQYGLPLIGMFEGHVQAGYHFLSDGFSLFTLSAGVAFGN